MLQSSPLATTQRIQLKILTLMYKCFNRQAPEYLQNLLVEMPTQRSGLRSKLTYKKLLKPFMKRKTFAQRYYSVAAPLLWNGLLLNIKQASTLNQFKSLFKHIYFIVFKLYLVIFYYELGLLYFKNVFMFAMLSMADNNYFIHSCSAIHN